MSASANEPLDVSDLPRLRDEDFRPVDPRYLRVALIGRAIAAAIVAIGSAVLLVVLDGGSWWALASAMILLGLIAASAVGQVIAVRHLGYQLRDRDVSVRRGVFMRSQETVPFVRVQHVRIRQGLVQRRFGLATVEVNSAGPDVHLVGLDAENAERIKQLVVDRASAAGANIREDE